MPHRHVIPGPPLSRFVELLWYYENAPQPHQKERLMPDGCISLVINLFEDETRLYDPDDMSNVRNSTAAASAVHTPSVLRSTPMNRPAWSAYRFVQRVQFPSSSFRATNCTTSMWDSMIF